MPTWPLSDKLAEDRWAASCELQVALWALNRSPCTVSVGESPHTRALTIWMDVPCPEGMQPAQQLARTRRFLRAHGVDGQAEFCAETYPRQVLTFPTAADVWRLSAAIVGQLSASHGARYRLSKAAYGIGIEWLSTVPYPMRPIIRPDDLSVGAAHRLCQALAQRSPALTLARVSEDEFAIEAVLNELKEAFSTAGVDMRLRRIGEGTVGFSCITPQAADQLAELLTQHTRRMRAPLAAAVHGKEAS
ncbi:hypothetical protein ABZ726_01665 [Streptomyces hundungensis]|uniref:hypothetical protein n=1 Tax=Streptomyces hundungensis TaxID=1077946 RepID=UPI003400BC6F